MANAAFSIYCVLLLIDVFSYNMNKKPDDRLSWWFTRQTENVLAIVFFVAFFLLFEAIHGYFLP